MSLKNRLAEAEEEKGNLQLKMVDFEEMRASIGNLKNKFRSCGPRRLTLCVVSVPESSLDKKP